MKQLMLVLMLVTAATVGGCDDADDVQKEIPGPSTRPDQPDSN
jgi:hypothetical protein